MGRPTVALRGAARCAADVLEETQPAEGLVAGRLRVPPRSGATAGGLPIHRTEHEAGPAAALGQVQPAVDVVLHHGVVAAGPLRLEPGTVDAHPTVALA